MKIEGGEFNSLPLGRSPRPRPQALGKERHSASFCLALLALIWEGAPARAGPEQPPGESAFGLRKTARMENLTAVEIR